MKDELYYNIRNKIADIFIENKLTNDDSILILTIMNKELILRRIEFMEYKLR